LRQSRRLGVSGPRTESAMKRGHISAAPLSMRRRMFPCVSILGCPVRR
jgi:hypothetical protein